MLAKTNRLLSAADFREVFRAGKRQSTQFMVVTSLITGAEAPARFGFVLTKKVGNAVTRNLVRRRLKAAARELVDAGLVGVDIVVRVTPAAVGTEWSVLRADLTNTVKGHGQ